MLNDFSINIKIESSVALKHENDIVIYIKGEDKPLIYKVFFAKESKIKLSPKTIPFLNLKRVKPVKKTATLFFDSEITVEQVLPELDWVEFIGMKNIDKRIVFTFKTIPEKMKKGFGKANILLKIRNQKGNIEEVKWPVMYNIF